MRRVGGGGRLVLGWGISMKGRGENGKGEGKERKGNTYGLRQEEDLHHRWRSGDLRKSRNRDQGFLCRGVRTGYCNYGAVCLRAVFVCFGVISCLVSWRVRMRMRGRMGKTLWEWRWFLRAFFYFGRCRAMIEVSWF